MVTFIRLDKRGHWRGVEHISSFQGLADEQMYDLGFNPIEGDFFEKGISCYWLEADGLAKLYKYWIETASITENDAKQMQVTIFEGEFVNWGSDGEPLATCTKTVKEFSASVLYEKWMELKERFYDDDETDAYDVTEYIDKYAQEILELLNNN